MDSKSADRRLAPNEEQTAMTTTPPTSLEVATACVPASPQSMIHFPLPLELREHIYGFLFGIEHDGFDGNEDEPVSPWYEFHGEIMEVNKTIRAEATACLYRSNRFIYFDHMFDPYNPAMDRGPVSFRLPEAHFKNARPMKLDSALRITFFCESRTSTEDEWRAINRTGGRQPKLMLMRDLPKLCETLRYFCASQIQEAMFVGSASGGDLPSGLYRSGPQRFGGASLHVDVLKPTSAVLPTSSGHLDDGAQGQVLQCLQTVLGLLRNPTLRGFSDTAHVRESITAMMPRLIWWRAREWDLLSLQLAVKERADAYALTGVHCKQAAALSLYHNLAEMPFFELSRQNLIHDRGHDAALTHVLICASVVQSDVALCYAQLYMKLGSPTYGGPWVIEQLEHSDLHSMPERTRQATASIMLAYNLKQYLSFEQQRSEVYDRYKEIIVGEAEERRDLMQAWMAAAEGMVSPGHDSYIDHDVALAHEVLDKGLTGAKDDLDFVEDMLKRISIYVMPFRVINSLPTDIQSQRPEGLEGWQDKVHKAQLSDAQRRVIHEGQRACGWEETEF